MLYEFCCEKCKHHFELNVPLKDRNKACKKPCPSCGEKAIERVYSSPTVIDPVRLGVRKPDKGFNEVLAKIQERNPHSNVQSKHF